MVKVEVRADEFSNDTSWHIIDYHTGEKQMKQRGYAFQQYEYKMKERCVSPGLYNFTIWDEYGDGEFFVHSNTVVMFWRLSCAHIKLPSHLRHLLPIWRRFLSSLIRWSCCPLWRKLQCQYNRSIEHWI